jgi:uncharacterized RDD family membrane protein YckC
MGKASFWQRLAAFGFDFIFVTGVMVGICLVTWQVSNYFPQAGLTSGSYDFIPPYPATILCLLFMAFYYGGGWALLGQTPGKMALNIRVLRVDGAKLGWKRALLRWVGYLISSLPLWLGFVWALFDRDTSGWHDKLAGSTVVKVDAAGEDMKSWRRWLVAGTMALVFVGVAGAAWVGGKLAGGFAVPEPVPSLEKAAWWLDTVWVLVLAVSALVPPLLVGVKLRWRWVLLSIAAGFAISLVVYLVWIGIVVFGL